MGLFDGLKAQADALPQYAQPQRTGLLGGIQNFLANNRGEGGFVDRLNMFGAQLQDTYGGGNRAGALAQQRQEMQAQQAAAQQRQQLNQLAQSLDMTPQERLLFQTNPEAWANLARERAAPRVVDGRIVENGQVTYESPEDPQYFNTSRGIYIGRGGEVTPGIEFAPDPLEQELMRARIAATQAQVGQREAAAARARRPAASGGRGGGGGMRAPSAPAARPWERY